MKTNLESGCLLSKCAQSQKRLRNLGRFLLLWKAFNFFRPFRSGEPRLEPKLNKQASLWRSWQKGKTQGDVLFFFWSVGLTSALFPIQFHICWRDKENDLFIRTWRENTHGGRIKYCVRLVCVFLCAHQFQHLKCWRAGEQDGNCLRRGCARSILLSADAEHMVSLMLFCSVGAKTVRISLAKPPRRVLCCAPAAEIIRSSRSGET